MQIELWLIIANTAFFILIWLVQVIIYPGLLHYSEGELARWHPVYTRRVSFITAPLIFSQLLLYTVSLVNQPVLLTIIGFILVIIATLITFLVAMPIHYKIDQRKETIPLRQKLVKINWYRTIAWSGSFILSMIEYGK